MIMRIKEYIKVSWYRIVEFNLYTICGIEFYRNYSRFYWKNKQTKNNTTLPFGEDYYF